MKEHITITALFTISRRKCSYVICCFNPWQTVQIVCQEKLFNKYLDLTSNHKSFPLTKYIFHQKRCSSVIVRLENHDVRKREIKILDTRPLKVGYRDKNHLRWLTLIIWSFYLSLYLTAPSLSLQRLAVRTPKHWPHPSDVIVWMAFDVLLRLKLWFKCSGFNSPSWYTSQCSVARISLLFNCVLRVLRHWWFMHIPVSAMLPSQSKKGPSDHLTEDASLPPATGSKGLMGNKSAHTAFFVTEVESSFITSVVLCYILFISRHVLL